MKTECIQPQDLPRILTLPTHEPQRQHLESCLHCRAMAHAYEEFMEHDGVRPDFDLAAADAELTERLAAIIDGSRQESPPPAKKSPFAGPRPWYAIAAVLVVCASIFLARDATLLDGARLPEGVGVARGVSEDITELAWVAFDDGWRLTWQAAATGKPVLVFFDNRLEEVARRPLAAETSVSEEAMAVPKEAVYLQLVFEDEGDVVVRSAVISARPPTS